MSGCCDLHGRRCEPQEPCCEDCTEIRHLGWRDEAGVLRVGHPRGEVCAAPDVNELIAFLKKATDGDYRYLKTNEHHLWTQRPFREVEAKRAIVAAYEAAPSDTLEGLLRHVAAVYRHDNDDYRQEWAP